MTKSGDTQGQVDLPHPERQCLQALPFFSPSPDGSLSPPLCPFLPSCRLPSTPSFSLSPPLCPTSPHPFSHSPPLCPPSPHPFSLSPPLCYPSRWAWEWPLLRPRASWRGWRPCLSASVNNLSPPPLTLFHLIGLVVSLLSAYFANVIIFIGLVVTDVETLMDSAGS